MTHICLHDRNEIEKFLRQNPQLHLYEIGDLDDRFWPHTACYRKLGFAIVASYNEFTFQARP